MNLFVLSELHPQNTHVGWSVSYSLEEVLADTCNANILYPTQNKSFQPLQRYQQRFFKSWYKLKELPKLGKGPNVLLVVGLGPHFLLSLFALGPLLQQFDLKIGYLLDGFDPAWLDRSLPSQLDHLFVMSAELAEELQSQSINASFLPLATNVLKYGSGQRQRSIDIIGYGRTNPDLHKTLQAHFNQQDSHRVYFHTTFSQPDVFNLGEHMMLLAKLLHKSKISLCFEPSNLPRFRGYSPILFRWFEGWACGCNLVGKRPVGKGVAELLDWENSTIELPDDPNQWVPFFEDLLDDEATLAANARRNYQECVLRHDWRYRIQTMLKSLDLPVPARLSAEIEQLQQSVGRVVV